MYTPRLLSTLSLLAAASAALALTGCAGMVSSTAPLAQSGVALSGSVHGGQQPVSGSRVYLYAAATTAYGASSPSLLGTGTSQAGLTQDVFGNNYVTTNALGQWTITNNYACPSASTQVYLIALGGNPGLAPGTNNSAISMLAGLGSCGNLTPSTFISINEVTTAATVTALQQFMSLPSRIGTSPTNATGLQNAFLAITNVVDISPGTARSTPISGNGSSPQTKLNTLGNILAPCINSAGPGSAACVSFFTAATPSGGTPSNDIVSAMLQIARNPGLNVPALFSQINASAPFAPSLSTAPNDFTLAVTFSGGGLTVPGFVAIDASGNAWTTNCPTCFGQAGIDSLVGFSPLGTPLSGPVGFIASIHKPQGIAFDNSGNLWSVNVASGAAPDQVVKMNTGGAVAPGFPFSAATLNGPLGIAIDTFGNAWVTNNPINSILNVSAAGAQLGSPITNAGFSNPVGIAVDPANNVFAAGTQSGSILKYNIASTSKSLFTAAFLTSPLDIAIDNGDNLWTLNNTNSFSVLAGTNGASITGSNAGINAVQATVIAIDGAGTGWLANCRAGCPGSGSVQPDNLLHFDIHGASLLGPGDGFKDSHLSAAGTAAIDASGNVWVSNSSAGSLTAFLGIASPIGTPLAHNVVTNQLGVRP